MVGALLSSFQLSSHRVSDGGRGGFGCLACSLVSGMSECQEQGVRQVKRASDWWFSRRTQEKMLANLRSVEGIQATYTYATYKTDVLDKLKGSK